MPTYRSYPPCACPDWREHKHKPVCPLAPFIEQPTLFTTARMGDGSIHKVVAQYDAPYGGHVSRKIVAGDRVVKVDEPNIRGTVLGIGDRGINVTLDTDATDGVENVVMHSPYHRDFTLAVRYLKLDNGQWWRADAVEPVI